MGIHGIAVEYVMTDALFIEGCHYPAHLILLELSKFDLILRMDWLGEHNVHIDCQERELVFGWAMRNQLPSWLKNHKMKEYMSVLRGSD